MRLAASLLLRQVLLTVSALRRSASLPARAVRSAASDIVRLVWEA
jgi:hypothetical protein